MREYFLCSVKNILNGLVLKNWTSIQPMNICSMHIHMTLSGNIGDRRNNLHCEHTGYPRKHDSW